MNERLKIIRESLHLSQDFVARHLNVTKATVEEIEAGTRKAALEELTALSRLYGVRLDELLCGKSAEGVAVKTFGCAFSELSVADKKEVLNLMNFKEHYKENLT